MLTTKESADQTDIFYRRSPALGRIGGHKPRQNRNLERVKRGYGGPKAGGSLHN